MKPVDNRRSTSCFFLLLILMLMGYVPWDARAQEDGGQKKPPGALVICFSDAMCVDLETSGLASDPFAFENRHSDQYTDYLRSLKNALGESKSPRDLAIAYQIATALPTTDPDALRREEKTLAAAANQAGLDDIYVQWLLSDPERPYRSNDSSNHAAALVRQDSRNGVTWLLEFDLAVLAKDDARQQLALEKLAAADYFDDFSHQSLSVAVEIVHRHEQVAEQALKISMHSREESDELLAFLAVRIAYEMPRHWVGPLLEKCRQSSGAAEDQTIRSRCSAIGHLMLHRSISISGRLDGCLLLQQAGSANASDIAELRALKWQLRKRDELQRAKMTDGRYFRDFVTHELAAKDSSDALRSTLLENNISVDPPDGWSLYHDRVDEPGMR